MVVVVAVVVADIAAFATSDEDGYVTSSSFGLVEFMEENYQEDRRRGNQSCSSDEEDSFIQHSQKHHIRERVNRGSKEKSGRRVLEPLPVKHRGKELRDYQQRKNADAMSNTRQSEKKKEAEKKQAAKKDRMDALEKELAALKKENKTLKRTNDDDGDQGESKRVKPDKFEAKAVKYDREEGEKYRKSVRKWVSPKVKFLATPEEAKECLKIGLQMTNVWTKEGLDKLSEDQLDVQMDECMAKYGKVAVMKNINTLRNQLISNLRKVVLDRHKEGKAFSAKQLLKVITRNPKLLC